MKQDDRLAKKEKEEEEKGKDAMPLAEKLVKSRSILLSKAVDDKMVESVSAQLLIMQDESPTEPIRVYVNSPGGAADCGFAIYDLFRFVEPRVITVCSGICASAAILIFLGGEKGFRFSLPNSRFLLHQPSTTAHGTASDLQITAQEIIKLRSRYNEIVGREIGKDSNEITDDCARDFWLNPEEALNYGLIDRIINSKDEIPDS